MRTNFALVCVAAIAVIAACGCSSGSSKSAAPSTTRRDATTTSSVTARVKGAGSVSTNPPAASTSTPTTDVTNTTATVPPTPATSPPPAVETTGEVTKAQQAVTARGFTPNGTDDFSNSAAGGLHVIVATANGRSDGYAQRAFFFLDGRFIGTDRKEPSATVKIAWRNDDTIALSYAAYKTGERLCCPTGGAIIVRYKWTGTRLKALDPIPPVSIRR